MRELETEKDSQHTIGLVYFLIIAIFFAGTVACFTYAQKYFGIAKLEKNGAKTSGTILRKIREPSPNGRGLPDYYIRYKFENTFTSQKCPLSRTYDTTPKYKACKVTYQIQSITEAEYKTIQAPQTVNVLYLPTDKKTRSLVTGLSYNKTSLGVNIILSLITMLMSFLFLIWQLYHPYKTNP